MKSPMAWLHTNSLSVSCFEIMIYQMPVIKIKKYKNFLHTFTVRMIILSRLISTCFRCLFPSSGDLCEGIMPQTVPKGHK